MQMLIDAGESQGGSNKLGGVIAVDVGEADYDKVQPVEMLAMANEV